MLHTCKIIPIHPAIPTVQDFFLKSKNCWLQFTHEVQESCATCLHGTAWSKKGKNRITQVLLTLPASNYSGQHRAQDWHILHPCWWHSVTCQSVWWHQNCYRIITENKRPRDGTRTSILPRLVRPQWLLWGIQVVYLHLTMHPKGCWINSVPTCAPRHGVTISVHAMG